MDTQNIKIAFVTDDGTTISPHFGRARYFEVITVENGRISRREKREKTGHHTFSGEEHGDAHEEGKHGFDEHSRHKHESMLASITDCQVVVARGMGAGAYDHITEAKMKPILTSLKTIDEAVQEIISGRITDHPERLH